MQKEIKVAYLLSNPIQYQAPMLKKLSELENINLEVLFQSKRSLKPHKMPGFNVVAEWDVDLLEGYRYTFLPCLGSDEEFTFFKPWNFGLFKKFFKEKYDVVWVHGYSSFFNLYAIVLAKLFGMKVLVRGESNLLNRKTSGWRYNLRRVFFTCLNKMTDGFLTIGTANRQFYQHFGIPENKLFFAPYTVDNHFFQEKVAKGQSKVKEIKQALQLEENKLIILYASSMLARKHPEDLLQAYINLSPDGKIPPNAYLIFIGDGAQRAELEKVKNKLGWETIKILGFKNQTELPAYYALSDVFVLPSNGETWGLVINEAMNAAKAVVATDQVGSGCDLIKADENGFIFPVRDVQALTTILNKLVVDPQLSKQMGEKSLQMINTWDIADTAKGIREACLAVMRAE